MYIDSPGNMWRTDAKLKLALGEQFPREAISIQKPKYTVAKQNWPVLKAIWRPKQTFNLPAWELLTPWEAMLMAWWEVLPVGNCH